MTPQAVPPTPHQQATDLRIGVLFIWIVGLWALALTDTKLHTGAGWGPLGVPALVDWCSTHALACTVVAVVVAAVLAHTPDPDQASYTTGQGGQ